MSDDRACVHNACAVLGCAVVLLTGVERVALCCELCCWPPIRSDTMILPVVTAGVGAVVCSQMATAASTCMHAARACAGRAGGCRTHPRMRRRCCLGAACQQLRLQHASNWLAATPAGVPAESERAAAPPRATPSLHSATQQCLKAGLLNGRKSLPAAAGAPGLSCRREVGGPSARFHYLCGLINKRTKQRKASAGIVSRRKDRSAPPALCPPCDAVRR